jgi:hypothetical protein
VAAFIPLALCLASGPGAVSAGDERRAPPVTVEAEVDRESLTVGDPIVLTLTIRHDPEMDVVPPGPGVDLGDFEVRSFRHLDVETESGLVKRGVRYVLTSFETGITWIPSLPTIYSTADGVVDTLGSELIKIEVESVLPSEAEDIMDIKGPVMPPLELSTILIAAVASTLLLVAAWYLYRYIRRRRTGLDITEAEQVPSRPPYEVALESLEQIKREGLLSDGRIKEYYSRVADTVRVYVDGRFGVPAMELTTPETLARFNILISPGAELRRILMVADLVKFAKLKPPLDGGIDYMEEAYLLLELTRPVETIIEREAAAVGPAEEVGS